MMIKVYTKENCGNCDLTKQFLINNNIEFIELDIYEHMADVKPLIDKGWKVAPIVFTDEDGWFGYDLGKLEGLLL